MEKESEAHGWREAMTEMNMADTTRKIDRYFAELSQHPHSVLLGRLITIISKLVECEKLDDIVNARTEGVIYPINGVLQALALDLHPFIRPFIGPDGDQNDRQLLINGCQFALTALMPQALQGDDIVLVPMPARVASAVIDGLHALAEGETPSIFAPAHGRHGEAHTWDKARARAAEHVAFMHAQGVTKSVARDRVASAIGVAPDTLRKWERDFGKTASIAAQAGQAETVEHDTGILANDLDAHVMHLLVQLRSEPLKDFGQRFRSIDPDRYWSVKK